MRTALLLLALAVLCVGAGAATAWPLLEHLGYALAAILILAGITAWAASRRLEIDRDPLPAAVMTDEALAISYRIRKTGLLPALQLSVEDADSGQRRRIGLSGRSQRTVTLVHSMARRGRYEIGAADVYAEDPLGIFRRRCARLGAETIMVYPRPIPVPMIPLPSASARASHHRWRLADADATLGDLRLYHPGDPPSRVHWPSTARTGMLMVTDPETHRPLTVWLLVDLGGETLPEQTAGIAVYLVQEIIELGLRLGTIVAGRETVSIRPGRGNAQELAILDTLATVTACRQSQLERLVRLASRLDHPGKLVVVSPAPVTSDQSRSLRRLCPDVTHVAAAPITRMLSA